MGARILVADDSVTIQKVVELTFSKEDFTLIQARSGEEALRRAREERPDLILLDLVMPDRNGYELCATLRGETGLRTVPIILLTGTFEAFDKEQGVRAGATDYITKPFESQALISKVKQLLFAKTLDGAPATTTAKMQPPAPAEGPPAQDQASELSPPTEEISQDRLWQLMDEPPAPQPSGPAVPQAPEPPPAQLGAIEFPPAPAEPAAAETELRLEEAPAVTSGAVETPALDLGSIELEPVELEPAATPAAGETLSVPQSLSLDDLLAGTPEGAPAPPEIKPFRDPEEPSGPVFELSMDEEPPLPMVQAGAGEPPGMPAGVLLTPGEAETSAPAEPPAVEVGELELVLPSGEAETGPPEETAPPAAAVDFQGPADFSPEQPEAPPFELSLSEEAPLSGEQPEGPPAVHLAEEQPIIEEAAAGLRELDLLAEESAPGAGLPPPAMAPAPDMAAMRDVVTERVAHELVRELSDKLVDRIEQIVWEVVPDLAETMISKEIERIRALADEHRPS